MPPTESAAKRRRFGCPSASPAKPAIPEDPLATYDLPCRLPGGLRARCASGSFARASDISWALGRLEQSVKPMYAGTALGWSKAQKRRELRAREQRIIFACRDGDGVDRAAGDGERDRVEGKAEEELVGFLSYRVDAYDWDGEEEKGRNGDSDRGAEYVVYVYEVFVASAARRTGVAQSLLELVERICECAGVPRIVLTVFDSNAGALRLYKERLKYKHDASCPSRFGNTVAKYQILTKNVHHAARDDSSEDK